MLGDAEAVRDGKLLEKGVGLEDGNDVEGVVLGYTLVVGAADGIGASVGNVVGDSVAA